MSGSTPKSHVRGAASRLAALVGLCLLLFLLYSANNGFPVGYHSDEAKKVEFILTGNQDFYHPLLMLDAVRAVNAVAGMRDVQGLVELGRLTSAIAGVAIALFTYVFARGWLGHFAALGAAALGGVTPIVAINSHYLKEDVLLTAGCMLVLAALQRHVERMSSASAAVLGLALGIAGSAKYAGLLLLPLLLIVPLVHRSIDRRAYTIRLAGAVLVAVAVFALLNYPLFEQWSKFVEGVGFETSHWLEGHDTHTSALTHWFGFHLVYSLAPGMTVPLLVLGLLAVAASLWRWGQSPWQQRLALVFVLGGYTVFELSPLKPFPGHVRYMLPLIPLLACLSVAVAAELAGRLATGPRSAVVWSILAVAGGVALADSIRLVHHLDRDTRVAAQEFLARRGHRPLFEWYAANGTLAQIRSLGQLSPADLERLRAEGQFDVLVASSLMYDRFEHAGKLPGQPENVYRMRSRYAELFAQPYVEIKPAYKTFAFSNPTLRIIGLSASSDSAGSTPEAPVRRGTATD